MRYIISLLLTSTAAFAEAPTVVTDIPPVHSLAAAVMKGVAEPELLLEKGASEHAYQLKPSQAGSIADADLVIWIGPELTPWLDSALSNRPADAAVMGLLDTKGTFLQDFGAAGEHDHAEESHSDETHTEEPAEAGHDDHAHEGADPHAWLDPANGKLWTNLIAAELSRLDPDNAATYAANATAAIAAIDAADAQATALLAPVKDRPFVAFHDAYGYFTAHYGLTMAGTVALGDASVPGAQRLVGLQEKVQSGAVGCLFPEVQHDPALIAQLAEGTGVAIGAPLDPAGAAMTPGTDLYPALLVSLAKTIATCAP